MKLRQQLKLTLIFLSFCFTQIIYAQNFTEVIPSGFEGVANSSVAFADVDGDNDPDVLIAGYAVSDERTARLYLNDGTGNFTEATDAPFDAVGDCAIAFADVDGDNDPDVLITGASNSVDKIAKLYTNDGQGNFTEVTGTPFVGVQESSVAFSDVDGDDDQDLLITGQNNSIAPVTKLYFNDGSGNFSEVLDTPFDDVAFSSVAFSDVDGDNDPDVFITGTNDHPGLAHTSKLYLNDGQGNFTEGENTPFEGVTVGSIAFSDVDGDNDPDLLITGADSTFNFQRLVARLYLNDGMGNFTEMTDTPFQGVMLSSIAFSDVDGDNDPDLLITGLMTGIGNLTSISYINDGTGNFTESSDMPFDGVSHPSVAFSDVDGDNDDDVLITGFISSDERGAKLYLNDLLSSTKEVNSDLKTALTLYPNPVTSPHILVDLPEGQVGFSSTQNGLVVVKVYHSNGQLLSQQKVLTAAGTQTLSVDVSGLSAGNYFIEIEDGERKMTGKFIVP